VPGAVGGALRGVGITAVVVPQVDEALFELHPALVLFDKPAQVRDQFGLQPAKLHQALQHIIKGSALGRDGDQDGFGHGGREDGREIRCSTAGLGPHGTKPGCLRCD